MSSGFPSGGSGDFYNNFHSATSFGSSGSGMMNNVQLQYRQQQLQQVQGNGNFHAKRSFSELEKQQQGGLLRSVKQRNQYNQTSPISPLTPFDFSGQNTTFSPHHAQLQQLQQLQQLRSLPANPNSNFYTGYSSTTNSNPNSSFSTANRPVKVEVEVEENGGESVRNRLQELEKQLLDDDDDDNVEDERDLVSGVTSSEWSETIQNLVTPIPNPFSPASSSSSSSAAPLNPSSKQNIIDIATAIFEGNVEIASQKLDSLKQISNPHGDSEQRLVHYMASAFRSRLNPTESPPPVRELFNRNQIMATQMLYEASPCFKLGFMASNLAILEVTRDNPTRIHVLDFDIGKGSQYDSLIHAFAERQQSKGIPITVKLTSVIVLDSLVKESMEDDHQIIGERLRKLADRVGICFRFDVVRRHIADMNQETFNCQSSEALVVNFAFRMYKLSDESVSTENPRDELLRLVKSLNPLVVNLLEQEMNCNTAPYVARVTALSSYYLALFNSLDSTMTLDRSDRVTIEEGLGRKMANSVASEGRDRVERCEVFGKWRARMRMAGLLPRPLGQHVAESMKARLNWVYKNSLFTVKEDTGGVCFGWNDRVLTVASSWC